MLTVYPVDDQVRQKRFGQVIAGFHQYNQFELKGEMYAVAETIRQIRGLKSGEYGVRELREELLSAHHRQF